MKTPIAPIEQRRLSALYLYKNNSNSRQQKELLELLLAVIPHHIVKEVVENLQIKF